MNDCSSCSLRHQWKPKYKNICSNQKRKTSKKIDVAFYYFISKARARFCIDLNIIQLALKAENIKP